MLDALTNSGDQTRRSADRRSISGPHSFSRSKPLTLS